MKRKETRREKKNTEKRIEAEHIDGEGENKKNQLHKSYHRRLRVVDTHSLLQFMVN